MKKLLKTLGWENVNSQLLKVNFMIGNKTKCVAYNSIIQ